MKWMRLMMICCGMAVKRMAVLGVSVREMKTLTVKMETWHWSVNVDIWRASCTTCMTLIVILFLSRHFILRGNLRFGWIHFPLAVMFYFRGRLRLESSCMRVSMVCVDLFLFLLTEILSWPTWRTLVEKVRSLLVTHGKQNSSRPVPIEIYHGLVVLWVTQILCMIAEFQSGCGRHLAHTSSVVFEIHIVSRLSCLVESIWCPDLKTLKT